MELGTIISPSEPDLVDATFVDREKRFTVHARLDDGTVVATHLADSGRLTGLLNPGGRLRLRPAAPESKRKTAFTCCLVHAPGADCWVSVEAARANRHAAVLLEALQLPWLKAPLTFRREVPHGNHRFDFLVTDAEGPCWVEVKSVSWVEDGEGLFPDAPTLRGVRHLRALADLARSGERTALLFVVQRKDARRVSAAADIDPAFAEALDAVEKVGTHVDACLLEPRSDGSVRWRRRIPVVTRTTTE